MAQRTNIYKLLPWIGGVNTSLDESMIEPGQLVEANNVVFGPKGSRKKREGIDFSWDDVTTGVTSIICEYDFWYGSATKSHLLVSLSDTKVLRSYNVGTGAASTVTIGGTAWGSAITKACMLTFTNLLIIAVDGSSNVLKKWTGSGDAADLGGTPPQASIVQEHQGRLWTDDKTRKDRLHYCSTGNAEQWNGVADSGVLDIGVGDGDPEGITAIFPTFKGDLFVAKKTKLYRIIGNAPENYEVHLVSAGIGCVSHNSIITVDQDDIIYASERGFHSLTATQSYGDFEGAFLSKDIQTTFTDSFIKSRLKYVQGAYLPDENSIAFAVTDSSSSLVDTINNKLWFYNFELKSWYCWPDIACQSIVVVNDSDQKRLYIGTNVSRVGRASAGVNYDTNTSNVDVPVQMSLETGYIYPMSDPHVTVGYKRVFLIYKPLGTHTITVEVKIDNYAWQPVTFGDSTGAALLGVDFILGVSRLSSGQAMAPYPASIDGYGRAIKLRITQGGLNEEGEIQGVAFEFEPSGFKDEVE